MKGRLPKARPTPLATLEQKRDMYGFMVRPQHLERYREHATIYQEEEAERSDRWEQLLSTTADNVPLISASEVSSRAVTQSPVDSSELDDVRVPAGSVQTGKDHEGEQGAGKLWGRLRESLRAIEQASIIKARDMRIVAAAAERIADSNSGGTSKATFFSDKSGHRNSSSKTNDGSEDSVEACQIVDNGAMETEMAPSARKGGEASGSGEDSEDEFCDATESADELREGESNGPSLPALVEFPWEEELRSLVRGGVPMALRGELWQVFVGTKVRRLHGHYNALLTLLADGGDHGKGVRGLNGSGSGNGNGITNGDYLVNRTGVLEKWTNQIEKDLPRTFPGHPALDEDGRNTLRRLLTAYARHNPQVGYCQAMNFLAALLLLLMPEENAFWSLTGIIDDYFEGYYSEKMVEAQVDQLVFEELVHENFPRLVGHLDELGVKVAWVSGPWFLSIFVNVLPWESVLRVWDVLLYEGNRCMLFRTGLALMEMHATALAGTRDAGDAVAMLQSMANDTFDSSQLVLTACMGFQTVTESKLQELRLKHRPEVLAALQERSTELHTWRNTNGSMAQKLPYLYRVETASGDSVLIKKSIVVSEENVDGVSNELVNGAHDDGAHGDQQAGLSVEGPVSYEESSGGKQGVDIFSHREEDRDGADAQEQVAWLKNELCRALEDKKAAVSRAEELETALMEIVKEDNRRLLAAKVEKLEAEVISLKQLLDDKKEQEQALVQVLVRMEQEQKIADDARRFSEQDSTAQRRAAEVFQEKYEVAADALSDMEKRAVMAETMLEATLSYQALGNNCSPSSNTVPRPTDPRGARAMDPKGGSPLSKGTPPGITSYQNGSGGTNVPAVDDNLNKQGIFNRPFGLNWRDRSKARTGSLDSPTRTSVQASAEQGPPILPSVDPDRAMSLPLLEKDSGSADGKVIGETLS